MRAHFTVRLPRNRLFRAQVWLHVLLPLLCAINLAARHSVEGAPDLRGYEVLAMVANLVAWPALIALIMVRRVMINLVIKTPHFADSSSK